MASYLLDTNVLSELVRPQPDGRVVRFLREQSDLWLSAVTLHEIAYGADRARDPLRRAKLIGWIESIRAQFAGRILAFDDGQALLAGRLRALAVAEGRADDPLDAMIAAAAAGNALTLATRNTIDFAGFGVTLFNPWTDTPGA
jgi:predicted nucleic acid-binding protein